MRTVWRSTFSVQHLAFGVWRLAAQLGVNQNINIFGRPNQPQIIHGQSTDDDVTSAKGIELLA
jgi:hypothetical protein